MPSTYRGNASLDIFWSRTLQNFKPFHFTGAPNINNTGAPNNNTSAIKEICFFTIFCDDNLINYTVEETNIFAQNHLRDTPSTSKSAKFSDVTPEQMKGFFGLIILMGIVKKPNLKMYFSTNEMLIALFFSIEPFHERFF